MTAPFTGLHSYIWRDKSAAMKFLFYDNQALGWVIRILFSFNIVAVGVNSADHFYPLDVMLMILIAFWLYSFRLKIVSLLPLLLALFINIQHTDIAIKWPPGAG